MIKVVDSWSEIWRKWWPILRNYLKDKKKGRYLKNFGKCDALQEKVTYVGKCNFSIERKIAGNLKKVRFQVLMDMCSRYIWEPCTVSKKLNMVWFCTGKRAEKSVSSLLRKGNLSRHNGLLLLFIHLSKKR